LSGVGAGEASAFTGHLIEMRCVVFSSAVTIEIVDAEIVAKNKNDIGFSHKFILILFDAFLKN
jgi:hypothetical protein